MDKPAPLQTVFPHGLLNFCTADFDQNHGTRFRDPSANIIAGHDRHLQYMTTEVEIRRATAGDAEAVYEIVLRALRETNARDYPASVIDRLVLTLPEGVASKLEEWQAYVAVVDGRIVGTGSLSGKTVRAVFVHRREAYQSRYPGIQDIRPSRATWFSMKSGFDETMFQPYSLHGAVLGGKRNSGAGFRPG